MKKRHEASKDPFLFFRFPQPGQIRRGFLWHNDVLYHLVLMEQIWPPPPPPPRATEKGNKRKISQKKREKRKPSRSVVP